MRSEKDERAQTWKKWNDEHPQQDSRGGGGDDRRGTTFHLFY